MGHVKPIAHKTQPETGVIRQLMERVLEKIPGRDFSVRLWDGSEVPPASGRHSHFTLVINRPEALKPIFKNPNSLTFGEAYIHRDIDIEGDLSQAIKLKTAFAPKLDCLTRLKIIWSLLKLDGKKEEAGLNTGGTRPFIPDTEDRERRRRAIGYHYDQPLDFWRQLLDDNFQYSCAYFKDTHEDLNAAQRDKLDHICRKLSLRPGDHLLDMGCGWGGLISHAARHYDVQATGITLSREQEQFARDWIRRQGLESRCRIHFGDIRDFQEPGAYDKAVSVGVIEHFDRPAQRDYFDAAWRSLNAGGLFLSHGMSSSSSKPIEGGPSFIDRYVFPDANLVPIHQTLQAAEERGFEVRDLENLREHYAQTVRCWLKNLARNREAILRIVGDETYRVFELYLSGFLHCFHDARIFLFQALLSKNREGSAGLPWTREAWYT